jgi:hypothetical protein
MEFLVTTALDVPISEFFAGASETSRSSFAMKSIAFDPQAFQIADALPKISGKSGMRYGWIGIPL